EDAGFPAVGAVETAPSDAPKVGVFDVLKRVFTNPIMWTIAIGSMMIGIVRRSIIDTGWWPTYMREVHHVSSAAYQFTSNGMAIGGIIGGFSLGWMSDRIFKTRRAPVVVIGFAGMAIGMGLFFASDALDLGPWAAGSCIILLSFF